MRSPRVASTVFSLPLRRHGLGGRPGTLRNSTARNPTEEGNLAGKARGARGAASDICVNGRAWAPEHFAPQHREVCPGSWRAAPGPDAVRKVDQAAEARPVRPGFDPVSRAVRRP